MKHIDSTAMYRDTGHQLAARRNGLLAEIAASVALIAARQVVSDEAGQQVIDEWLGMSDE